MKKFLELFAKDEDGAVTVDWVVLTAAIVGIALAIVAVIRTSLDAASTQIALSISNAMTAT